VKRIAERVLPALAGFLATCALLGALADSRAELRLLPWSVEGQKHRQFRTGADEYDLVYVGTSRVHRGFDPGAFDERMAALGRPLCSYNFGLVGLGFLEELHLVEWILALEPRRLRWILIDPPDHDGVLQRANLFTPRDVAWHTPALTLRGVRAAWTSGRGLGERLELARLHLLHGAQRFCNVGLGASLLAWLWSTEERAEVAPDGFGGKDSREAAAREPEARVERDGPRAEPSPLLWTAHRAAWERARAAGLQPFFVVPPTPKALKAFREAHEAGHLPELLTYPARDLPEVFARPADTFYDEGHLNRLGAQLFSRRLAADLLPRLEPAPSPQGEGGG
jgi:hypothetical protein